MDKKWLLGFIEGSGCFSIIIKKSKNHVGYQTSPDFSLKLPSRQKPLLEGIFSFLGMGKIYDNGKEAVLKVTKLDDAKKLVQFFESERFVSEEKKREFDIWKTCVDMIAKGLHHTSQGILEIARQRDSIHVKKLWNKKNFCNLRLELDPCHIYQQTHSLPQGCRICWEGETRLVQLPIKEVT